MPTDRTYDTESLHTVESRERDARFVGFEPKGSKMTDRVDREAVERLARDADEGELSYDDPVGSVLRALLAERDALKAELAEARRRRDAWKSKAEGYDEVRLALREKVGTPWPPNMSRILWAAIAADEKKRADDAEAERDRLRDENQKLHHLLGQAATWIEFTALLVEGSDKRPNILGEIAAALKGDQT